MRTDLNTQWLAGFFDGEGSIGIYNRNTTKGKTKRYYVLVVSLAQSGTLGKGILEQVVQLYGGCLYLNKNSTGKKRKEMWKWNISADKASRFLTELLPYLQIKKEEALLALSFQELENKSIEDPLAKDYAIKVKELKLQ